METDSITSSSAGRTLQNSSVNGNRRSSTQSCTVLSELNSFFRDTESGGASRIASNSDSRRTSSSFILQWNDDSTGDSLVEVLRRAISYATRSAGPGKEGARYIDVLTRTAYVWEQDEQGLLTFALSHYFSTDHDRCVSDQERTAVKRAVRDLILRAYVSSGHIMPSSSTENWAVFELLRQLDQLGSRCHEVHEDSLDASDGAACISCPWHASVQRMLCERPELLPPQPTSKAKSFPSRTIAQQLCLVDSAHRQRLSCDDLLYHILSEPHVEVMRWLTISRDISIWVTFRIVSGETAQERAATMSLMLEVAQHLESLHCTNMLYAVVHGLMSKPIKRMACTLATLGRPQRNTWLEFETKYGHVRERTSSREACGEDQEPLPTLESFVTHQRTRLATSNGNISFLLSLCKDAEAFLKSNQVSDIEENRKCMTSILGQLRETPSIDKLWRLSVLKEPGRLPLTPCIVKPWTRVHFFAACCGVRSTKDMSAIRTWMDTKSPCALLETLRQHGFPVPQPSMPNTKLEIEVCFLAFEIMDACKAARTGITRQQWLQFRQRFSLLPPFETLIPRKLRQSPRHIPADQFQAESKPRRHSSPLVSLSSLWDSRSESMSSDESHKGPEDQELPSRSVSSEASDESTSTSHDDDGLVITVDDLRTFLHSLLEAELTHHMYHQFRPSMSSVRSRRRSQPTATTTSIVCMECFIPIAPGEESCCTCVDCGEWAHTKCVPFIPSSCTLSTASSTRPRRSSSRRGSTSAPRADDTTNGDAQGLKSKAASNLSKAHRQGPLRNYLKGPCMLQSLHSATALNSSTEPEQSMPSAGASDSVEAAPRRGVRSSRVSDDNLPSPTSPTGPSDGDQADHVTTARRASSGHNSASQRRGSLQPTPSGETKTVMLPGRRLRHV